MNNELTLSLFKNLDNFKSLNLLYRGSEDSFEAEAFHDMCDNKGATLVIAKCKET